MLQKHRPTMEPTMPLPIGCALGRQNSASTHICTCNEMFSLGLQKRVNSVAIGIQVLNTWLFQYTADNWYCHMVRRFIPKLIHCIKWTYTKTKSALNCIKLTYIKTKPVNTLSKRDSGIHTLKLESGRSLTYQLWHLGTSQIIPEPRKRRAKDKSYGAEKPPFFQQDTRAHLRALRGVIDIPVTPSPYSHELAPFPKARYCQPSPWRCLYENSAAVQVQRTAQLNQPTSPASPRHFFPSVTIASSRRPLTGRRKSEIKIAEEKHSTLG